MFLAAEESKKNNSKASWPPISWDSLWRTIRRNWIFLYVLSFTMIEFNRKHPWSGLRIITIWTACCLIFVLFATSLRFARDTAIRQALEGNYEASLRLNKKIMWIPGFGGSLEGWILLEAGRYSEAEAVTKPLAFDSHNNPRLASWQLYYYAMALSHQGEYRKSYFLLGSALQLKPNIGRFHLGSADCLLEHNGDPEAARFLMDRILANWQAPSLTFRKRSEEAQRRAQYAWALARCSRREEAMAQMQEASEESETFIPRDQAWLLYYAGETWWALGNRGKAQDAFEKAAALYPYGQLVLRSQKRLSELNRLA
jgi:tetratricopeptide (TPR) repeat protein